MKIPLIALAIALLLALSVGLSEAHTEGKMQLSAAEAGPFKVTVWTSPDPSQVGELHVAAAVVTAEDAAPVLDAMVMVGLTPTGGGETLVSQATTEDSENKFLYEAVFDVAEPGTYQVEIQISGAEGESGAASFELAVEGNSGFNFLYLIPLALGVGAIVLVVVALRRPSSGEAG